MAKVNTADILKRRYKKTKSLCDDVFTSKEVNLNLYNGIINVDDNYDWEYSLVDPQIFPLVRNYLSRSNPAQNALRLDIRRQDQFETRQVNQDFLNWEIGELMSTTLFYKIYFSSYLRGRGYGKDGWKYEKAIEIQEQDEQGNIIKKKILRDITNRADAKFVRFNNILIPDRNNPELKSQPYIIELIPQRVGDMLDENQYFEDRGEKAYWDKKFLKKLKDSGVSGKLLEYEMERATDSDSKDDLSFRSAIVPMMCMHNLENDVLYMPLEDDTIINTDHTNRYWHGHYPYFDFCPFPQDDEYFNVALVDIVGDLQIASTEVLNQTLTNIRQINNDMWVAGTSAAQTPDWQFRKRPDGVIRVMGDTSQIQQITTRDNTRPAMLMGQDLANRIEKAGGISSLYSSGVPNQSVNQTARGAQIIDQNIDTNMKMILDLFGEQVLKVLGEHFLELNAQYVTEAQTFAITGKKNVKDLISITPEQINANFIVSVNSDRLQKQTPASRQASIQNTITVLQNIETQSQGALQMDLTPVIEALIDATPEMDDVGNDVVTSLDEKSNRDCLMIQRGQLPTIKIRDPHADLIMAANIFFGDNVQMLPPEIQKILEEYIQKHIKFIQAKQQLQALTAPPSQPGQPQAPNARPIPQNQGQNTGLPGNTYNLQPLNR